MKKAESPITLPPRKKMPAEVFIKMWLNRANDAEEREWKEWVVFDTVQGGRRANLSNVEIEGNILIENTIEPVLHLKLSNCNLPNCELKNAKICSVVIQNNTEIGDFQIKNSTTADFQIENSTIENFEIRQDSNTGSFAIKDSAIKQLKIKSSTAESVVLTGGSVNELIAAYTTLKRIEIVKGCEIGRFRCRLPLQNPAQITLEKSSFGKLDFDNTVLPEFATVQVFVCKVNQVSFHNFCNFGAIFLSDLEIFETDNSLSTLRLTDSDLGKMQFINCDLRQFQRFEFSNTKMLDVFVAGSQMPNAKAFCLPNDEQDLLKIAEQKRLAYGQFKKIYEARGDTAGSLSYLAYEMQAYREELRLEEPMTWQEWFDNRGECFILWFNRHSTNYGNNWLRGVLVTLFVTVVCFSIYCFLLGYRPQPIHGDWEKFGDLASHSLAYLNPFRDEDSGEFFEMLKEDGLKITWYARLWDYISRIFIAYFVYQTIQAFRKLGKSSG